MRWRVSSIRWLLLRVSRVMGNFAFLFKATLAEGTEAGLKLSLPAVTPLLPTTH